jgi:hypothetical protein
MNSARRVFFFCAAGCGKGKGRRNSWEAHCCKGPARKRGQQSRLTTASPILASRARQTQGTHARISAACSTGGARARRSLKCMAGNGRDNAQAGQSPGTTQGQAAAERPATHPARPVVCHHCSCPPLLGTRGMSVRMLSALLTALPRSPAMWDRHIQSRLMHCPHQQPLSRGKEHAALCREGHVIALRLARMPQLMKRVRMPQLPAGRADQHNQAVDAAHSH